MTVTTAPPPGSSPRPRSAAPAVTGGHLAELGALAILGGSVLLSLLVFGLAAMAPATASTRRARRRRGAALSRAHRRHLGHRRRPPQGVDRLVTGLVTGAFLLAMVPLISVA